MTIDRHVLLFAGALTLISLALGWLVSPVWLLVTAFMGFNLLQASQTGFCPLAWILKRMGVRSGGAFR